MQGALSFCNDPTWYTDTVESVRLICPQDYPWPTSLAFFPPSLEVWSVSWCTRYMLRFSNWHGLYGKSVEDVSSIIPAAKFETCALSRLLLGVLGRLWPSPSKSSMESGTTYSTSDLHLMWWGLLLVENEPKSGDNQITNRPNV